MAYFESEVIANGQKGGTAWTAAIIAATSPTALASRGSRDVRVYRGRRSTKAVIALRVSEDFFGSHPTSRFNFIQGHVCRILLRRKAIRVGIRLQYSERVNRTHKSPGPAWAKPS